MNCKPSLKPTLRAGRRKKRSSSPSRTGLYVCSLPPLLLLPPSPLWAHGHDPFPAVLTGRPETSRVPARQSLRSKPDFVPCAWEVPGLAAAMLRCLTEIHLPPMVTGPHAPLGDVGAADLPVGLSRLLGVRDVSLWTERMQISQGVQADVLSFCRSSGEQRGQSSSGFAARGRRSAKPAWP